VEVGPKGAVISFRNNVFANPAGLVAFITNNVGTAKLRPDHKLVYRRAWDNEAERLAGIRRLTAELSRIATAPEASRQVVR
jgi:transcription-repair coupling factor (superfamily II helicase)